MRINRYKLEKKVDERGWLVQNTEPKIMEQARHFILTSFAPGVIRGNHYHKRKEEWFYILQGKVKIYLLDIRTGESKTFIADGTKPEMVKNDPYVVHTIENIGSMDAYFLGFVNEVFNPADPDTYYHKLR